MLPPMRTKEALSCFGSILHLSEAIHKRNGNGNIQKCVWQLQTMKRSAVADFSQVTSSLIVHTLEFSKYFNPVTILQYHNVLTQCYAETTDCVWIAYWRDLPLHHPLHFPCKHVRTHNYVLSSQTSFTNTLCWQSLESHELFCLYLLSPVDFHCQ